jgi:hypothetical protein
VARITKQDDIASPDLGATSLAVNRMPVNRTRGIFVVPSIRQGTSGDGLGCDPGEAPVKRQAGRSRS